MEIGTKKGLRYTFEPSYSSGGRKSWERIVTQVDRTQRGVKGLIGRYLRAGHQVDLAEGTIIVEVDHRGSVNDNYCVARVVVVRDGEFVVSGWFHWTRRYLDLLDRVEAALTGAWPSKQQQEPTPETTIASPVAADAPAGATPSTDLPS